jgi:hypothetical protein
VEFDAWIFHGPVDGENVRDGHSDGTSDNRPPGRGCLRVWAILKPKPKASVIRRGALPPLSQRVDFVKAVMR